MNLASMQINCPYCNSKLKKDGYVLECECGYSMIMKAVSEPNIEKLYEKAGIPVRYRKTEWNDKRAAFGKTDRGLYMEGGYGTGKTAAAMAVARYKLEQGWSVVCTSGVRTLSELRDSLGDNEQIFDRLAKADLLIIDDLGKENPTEWTVSMLYRIIDDRYQSLKPIVITSNYSKQELVQRLTINNDSSLAESIVSRLFQMTKKVEFDGDDYRLVAKC